MSTESARIAMNLHCTPPCSPRQEPPPRGAPATAAMEILS